MNLSSRLLGRAPLGPVLVLDIHLQDVFGGVESTGLEEDSGNQKVGHGWCEGIVQYENAWRGGD